MHACRADLLFLDWIALPIASKETGGVIIGEGSGMLFEKVVCGGLRGALWMSRRPMGMAMGMDAAWLG